MELIIPIAAGSVVLFGILQAKRMRSAMNASLNAEMQGAVRDALAKMMRSDSAASPN